MTIHKINYNQFGMLFGVSLTVTLLILLGKYQDNLPEHVDVLLSGIIVLLFFLVGAYAEISGGYSWKNGAPLNNGFSRKKQPVKFWIEVGLKLAFGLLIFVLCVMSYVLKWTN